MKIQDELRCCLLESINNFKVSNCLKHIWIMSKITLFDVCTSYDFITSVPTCELWIQMVHNMYQLEWRGQILWSTNQKLTRFPRKGAFPELTHQDTSISRNITAVLQLGPEPEQNRVTNQENLARGHESVFFSFSDKGVDLKNKVNSQAFCVALESRKALYMMQPKRISRIHLQLVKCLICQPGRMKMDKHR